MNGIKLQIFQTEYTVDLGEDVGRGAQQFSVATTKKFITNVLREIPGVDSASLYEEGILMFSLKKTYDTSGTRKRIKAEINSFLTEFRRWRAQGRPEVLPGEVDDEAPFSF